MIIKHDKELKELLAAVTWLENIIATWPTYERKEFYYTFNRRLEALHLVMKYCKRGSTIFDIGAGQGFHSLILKKIGYNIIAVDIDDRYAHFLRKNGVKFYKADIEHDLLPFDEVDCILFTEVIEHFIEHLKPSRVPIVLSKFYSILKSKGVLIITTPNAKSIGKLMKRLAGKPVIPHIHIKEYTMKELTSLLHKAGFKLLLTRFSLSTYLNPRKARNIVNYKGTVMAELFRTPHLENLAQAIILPIAILLPSLRGSFVLVAQKEGT